MSQFLLEKIAEFFFLSRRSILSKGGFFASGSKATTVFRKVALSRKKERKVLILGRFKSVLTVFDRFPYFEKIHTMHFSGVPQTVKSRRFAFTAGAAFVFALLFMIDLNALSGTILGAFESDGAKPANEIGKSGLGRNEQVLEGRFGFPLPFIDLSLSKSASPSVVELGDTVTFSLKVKNASLTDAASSVTVTSTVSGSGGFV